MIKHLSLDRFPPQNPLEIHKIEQMDLPLHKHEFMELVFVISGTGSHETEKGNYTLKSGDIFAIPPEMSHGYRHCDHLVLYNLLFDEQALTARFPEIQKTEGYEAFFRMEPQLRDLHDFKSRLYLSPGTRIFEKLPEGCEKNQTLWVGISLIINVCEYFSKQGNDHSDLLIGLGRVLSALEGRYSEKLTTVELASLAGMSRSSFFRHFEKAMGQSPQSYLFEVRMSKAKEYIKRGDYSVCEIASLCGYGDPDYFSRRFKERFGVPPSALKNKIL